MRHIPAIFFVLGAELPAQRGFLIEHDEQSDAEYDCESDHNGEQVCLPVMKPRYIGFRHTPVKAHDNELLRRKFPACLGLETRWGTRFYQESARAKTENGNSPVDVLGLLGLIAACLV